MMVLARSVVIGARVSEACSVTVAVWDAEDDADVDAELVSLGIRGCTGSL
jgi:hypothetical protein